MKKFNEILNENNNHYASDKKLNNELYNLIEETLTSKMDGEVSEKLSLIGKDELVNELIKIVENEVNKHKIKLLEMYKNNPSILHENIVEEDELKNIIMDIKKTSEKEEACDCTKKAKKCDCGK